MLTSESFESLFTNSPTAMLVEGEDGGVMDANESACRLFGTNRDDIVGRQSSELIPEEDRLADCSDGKPRLGSLSSISGTTVQVSMHSAQLETSSETASLISIWPVTQNGSCSEMDETKEAGHTRVQQASQHIANVISDSLTPIQGFISLAQEDLKHGRIQSSHLQQIATAADSGATFARQLFTFSRIPPKNVEALSPRALIESLKQELVLITGDAITINFNTSQETPDIRISRNDFRTIMRHSIRNAAAKADKNRRINVTCSTEPGNEPSAIIIISDNAPPLNEAGITHAFTPFFSLPERGDPNGLRLPIVKQLMRNHGGTIKLQSTLEDGTTLTLSFPHSHH